MLSIWTVDAFTSTPFAGNPAAICILSDYKDDAFCQLIARELNLSETAFVVPVYNDIGNNSSAGIIRTTNTWKLRWFTPTTEVKFCGHATLASTHLLFSKQFASANEKITFETKFSGKFFCECLGNNEYSMNLPALKYKQCKDKDSDGGSLIEITRNALQLSDKNAIVSVVDCDEDLLVELKNADAIINCNPNFNGILANEILNKYRGIEITAKMDGYKDKYDIISRFFCPMFGVNEDPVTGSAHSGLAVYWSDKLNKRNEWIHAFQASERGGSLKIKYNTKEERVVIVGSAVTVMECSLAVPTGFQSKL